MILNRHNYVSLSDVTEPQSLWCTVGILYIKLGGVPDKLHVCVYSLLMRANKLETLYIYIYMYLYLTSSPDSSLRAHVQLLLVATFEQVQRSQVQRSAINVRL